MSDRYSPDEKMESYWYRPGGFNLDEQGNLLIKYSGYDDETAPYTGYRGIEPSAPDYACWVWLTEQDIPGSLVSKEQIVNYRAEYDAKG